MRISRRLALGAGLAALTIPAVAFGATTRKRLAVVILRGGLDGLAAAPPVGDPAYAAVRGPLAFQRGETLPLDGTFALHPKLAGLKAAWDARELIVCHAVGTSYHERSHFDAQNVLETGAARPYARDSGWLNAALGALPAATSAGRREMGMALSQQAPLILRGPASVGVWSPSALPDADANTVGRILALYRKRDAALAASLESAMAANAIAAEAGSDMAGGKQGYRSITPIAKAAAGFLKQPDGPVAAVIEMTGWDSHANQGTDGGQLAGNLAALDAGLVSLKQELGPVWADTAVLVVTEFGRTAGANGNRGTDHGAGAAAFLVGGAVAGGRVLADWPGLAPAQLFEGRDLRITADIRGVMKGLLADHLGVARVALGEAFPDSAGVAPAGGLLRG